MARIAKKQSLITAHIISDFEEFVGRWVRLEWEKSNSDNQGMNRDAVIATLRSNEEILRSAGVSRLSLFGSVARGEEATQDVDIAVRLDKRFSEGGFDYFGSLERLEERLSALLGCKVDIVEEPVRKLRFQQEIDRDRAVAF